MSTKNPTDEILVVVATRPFAALTIVNDLRITGRSGGDIRLNR